MPSSGQIAWEIAAGADLLAYDSAAAEYTYVRKSGKAWAGECGQQRMALRDGTVATTRSVLR